MEMIVTKEILCYKISTAAQAISSSYCMIGSSSLNIYRQVLRYQSASTSSIRKAKRAKLGNRRKGQISYKKSSSMYSTLQRSGGTYSALSKVPLFTE